MKKRINFTVALIIAMTITFGYSQGVEFGIKGGVNLANASSSASFTFAGPAINVDIDTKTRTSFNFGVFIEYPLGNSDKLFTQVELNYSGNGYVVKGELGSGSTLKIQQINLPFMLKYSVFDNLYINAGGYLGYISDIEVAFNDDTDVGQDESQVIADEFFGNFDAGVLFGVEYQFNQFFVDVRYNLGLVNIGKEVKVESEELEGGVFEGLEFKSGLNHKNRVFQIGVGYRF